MTNNISCLDCVCYTGLEYCRRHYRIVSVGYAVDCEDFISHAEYECFLDKLDRIHSKVDKGDYSDFTELQG